MQLRFVLLVENIFTYSFGSNNWHLKSITKQTDIKEFEAIFYFLHNSGPLFHLIRNLMIDSNNRYEFSLSKLSVIKLI